MNCIIVDDEPLAREAIELQIFRHRKLNLSGQFNSAISAARFMAENPVDLVLLDIRMPGVIGLEFARTIPKKTLVIFTTAYTEYALESYEVDAILSGKASRRGQIPSYSRESYCISQPFD